MTTLVMVAPPIVHTASYLQYMIARHRYQDVRVRDKTNVLNYVPQKLT